jgi:hypothetical protein
MELLQSRILLRALVGIAGPDFMLMDILTAARSNLHRGHLPPNIEANLERMRFETIISGNYVKAFMLLVFSLVAMTMVVFDLR